MDFLYILCFQFANVCVNTNISNSIVCYVKDINPVLDRESQIRFCDMTF